MSVRRYKLSQEFLDQYKNIKPNWGFMDEAGNSMGEITFLRSYSRLKEDGSKETWADTCQRVIEGMFTVQREHCRKNRLPWDYKKAQRTAQDAYDRMFNFKWLPPGRGIANMGAAFVLDEWDATPLQNCAFVSTEVDFSEAMHFLMLASMNGVGVGFDVSGAGRHHVRARQEELVTFVIPDTREGWAEALKKLIDSYLNGESRLAFDYSLIRPAGSPIARFGGTASGPESLKELLEDIDRMLHQRVGETLTVTDIADIGNKIGCCVVSGSSRRSAELLLGPQTEEYMDLKNYGKTVDGEWVEGPAAKRAAWGWMSNNSIFAEVGQDYKEVAQRTLINGEPGYVWMDTTRGFGRMKDRRDDRDFRAAGYNPCAEQPLESWEMCVAGNTLIQTRTGIDEIKNLVGKEVEIWNGEKWSKVKPFSTGANEIYRVFISDGSYLDVTPGHEWAIETYRNNFKKLKTSELTPGMKLPDFSLDLSTAEGISNNDAYTYGWFAGDGCYKSTGNAVAIVKTDETEALNYLNYRNISKAKTFGRGSAQQYHEVTVNIPNDDAYALRKEDRLPESVLNFDKDSIASFFGGWIDTDGSLSRQENTDNYVLYGSEGMLRQAQILLRRIGVNHSTLRLLSPKGFETSYGVRTKDLYRLTIPSYEASAIKTVIKRAERFGDSIRANPAHEGSVINSAKRQKIVAIEKISDSEDTYCFTEEELHMGVFGNVLTHQCTLVETYPTRAENVKDYLRTLKVAYLYAKTVTLIPTVFERTNAVMMRNRRIGLSQTGISTYVEQHGISKWRELSDAGYKEIQRLDDVYSDWLCVRNSIRTTTVKPSGTVSLLTGDSPGVHWNPASGFYIRRVTMGAGDLLDNLRDAGYPVEPSFYSKGQWVVSFPVKSPFLRSEKDVTIWEKVALAAEAQHWWSDNSVSVTVSYDKETEGQHIPAILSLYEGRLKTLSFLPMGKDTYKQMPYEEITESEYLELCENLFPLDREAVYRTGLQAEGEQFCTTDKCLLPTP